MIALPFRVTPRQIGRTALVLAAIYGVGWLLWSARSALTPFIFGAVLAYLFLPLVNRLNRQVPRWAAILLVYLLVLILVVTFFAFLVPPLIDQLAQAIDALPSIPQIQGWADMLLVEYRQILANLPDNVRPQVQEVVGGLLTQGLNTLRSNFVDYMQSVGRFLLDSVLSVANTVSFLLGFFLVPFWLFYVLMDQRAGSDTLNRTMPPWVRRDFWGIVSIVNRDFSGYLRGQLLLGLAVGSAAGIGLFVLSLFGLRVPYILLLAVIAGITELVPVIGPIIGSVPAIILGFLDSPTTGVAVLLLYVAIQQLENNFLVPRIVGESVGLHPAVLMVLLVVCAQVFGLAGAILSAPMGAVARDVFTYLYGRLSDPPTPAGQLPERLRDAPGTPAQPPMPLVDPDSEPDRSAAVASAAADTAVDAATAANQAAGEAALAAAEANTHTSVAGDGPPTARPDETPLATPKRR